MRSWAAALAVLFSANSWGQSALDSAKKDLALPTTSATTNSSGGIMQLLQLVIAVGIVLVLLKWLLPKILSKFNKRIHTSLGSSIKIEESASFAGGMLYVVSARNKQLLLCAGQQGVTFLADLTPSQNKEPEQDAFFELLDAAQTKPQSELFKAAVHVPAHEQEPPSMSPDEAQIALERLRKIAG